MTVNQPGGGKVVVSYTQGVLTGSAIWNGAAPQEEDFGPSLTADASGGTLLDLWDSDTGGDPDSRHLRSVR